MMHEVQTNHIIENLLKQNSVTAELQFFTFIKIFFVPFVNTNKSKVSTCIVFFWFGFNIIPMPLSK